MSTSGPASSAGRSFVGRIPGRPGLWELVLHGYRIESLVMRDESYADTRCAWLTPGLFDLQVNGIGGVSFTDPELGIEAAGQADSRIRETGTSRYCPTIISCSLPTALHALRTLAGARSAGLLPGASGAHLEGPWISPVDGVRGVHRREHVRGVSLDEWAAMRRAAEGLGRSNVAVSILTLAPEVPGALDLARLATRDGTVVSLGHTAATPMQVSAAVQAGARMSTHLFNGCAQMLDRHANVVYAQLAEDALQACFIADGHHVPFDTLRVAMRAKGPQRCILVSDCAHLSGLPDGEYEMEGNTVELRDGGLRVKGSTLLSGAARTLAQDVELLARQPEPGIEAALLMATRNPAALLADSQWAELREGREGPVAVFTWDGTRLALEHRAGF